MKCKEDKRELIIQKGSDIMNHKGYNGTGVQEIVDAAQIPKGSFYNYFKSKEDFAVEAIKYYSNTYYNLLETNLKGQKMAPLERIKQIFFNIAERYEKSETTCGCFIGNMCQEMANVNKPIAEAVDDAYEHFKAPITQCLRQAQRNGDLNPSRDIDKLSEFIFNSWEGALMRMKASKSMKPLTAFHDILSEILAG
ncbi:MAG TPA: TetR family transcriptional regulator [Spirochaetes bacterium]|nr:TetR family transcriptional regulator [Spirochaetota bacterium]